jgi:hypothetical protein
MKLSCTWPAVPSHAPSHTTQTLSSVSPTSEQHVEPPDVADSSDSDSDEGGPAEEDNITADDFKPLSFSLETEADVAMDMDSVTEYFEDDDYPWEDTCILTVLHNDTLFASNGMPFCTIALRRTDP